MARGRLIRVNTTSCGKKYGPLRDREVCRGFEESVEESVKSFEDFLKRITRDG